MSAKSATTGTLEAFYQPRWAGGWTVARWLFALACLLNIAPRVRGIGDVYAAPDMVFTTGWYRLADYVTWSEPTAYTLWGVGVGAALATFLPGRSYKPALLIFTVCFWALVLEEALNVKAYDRLMGWLTIGFLLSPAHETHLTEKWRSPLARYWMLIVYIAIYESTGMMKLLKDPGWWDGSVLSWHLVHQFHANNALAAWVSGQTWLLAPMCWWTLFFELFFPVLVFFRRTNPTILALGFSFHLGLLALMNVGPFGFVAIAAYPVLLHPDVGEQLWRQYQNRSKPT